MFIIQLCFEIWIKSIAQNTIMEINKSNKVMIHYIAQEKVKMLKVNSSSG